MKKYKCTVDKNTVDDDGDNIKDCCRQDTCCEFCDYEDCHEGCLNANKHNCSETCEFCYTITM